MLPLRFGKFADPPVILCVGAHCDDIEIGCGATLVRLRREYPDAQMVWAIFASENGRDQESRAAAGMLVGERTELRFLGFQGSYFPAAYAQIKDAFEQLKSTLRPELIFTHCLDDRHQDHRTLAELTWNTFRAHLILEYEIPKYEGDLGHPNTFAACTSADLDLKIRTLLECFPSQRGRSWFTEDTFRALARLRGIECAAPTGFAEAFHARKLCL